MLLLSIFFSCLLLYVVLISKRTSNEYEVNSKISEEKIKDLSSRIENLIFPTVPSLKADRNQMKQVLLNLVDNAIKFNSSNGSVKIEAEVDQSSFKLSVQDSGSGISELKLSRVFERFYRVDKGRSREEGGTGLGLAIVKHIAESHGGSASSESQLGQGSKFILVLSI